MMPISSGSDLGTDPITVQGTSLASRLVDCTHFTIKLLEFIEDTFRSGRFTLHSQLYMSKCVYIVAQGGGSQAAHELVFPFQPSDGVHTQQDVVSITYYCIYRTQLVLNSVTDCRYCLHHHLLALSDCYVFLKRNILSSSDKVHVLPVMTRAV